MAELLFAINHYGRKHLPYRNEYTSWTKANKKMHNLPVRGACLGFSGPDDRVVSLNVPAATEDGQGHPHYSFDIEYDPEQPDRLTICLLELDQDNFIHAVQKSIAFPAGLLTELLSRRKATAEEVAAWRNTQDGDE